MFDPRGSRPARLSVRPWVVLLMVLALALAACNGDPEPEPDPDPDAAAPDNGADTNGDPPTEGGTIVVALGDEPESMDPYFVYQVAGFSVMHNIFDSLLWVDYDGGIVPLLAEDWEIVDDTTLRFHLRQGVVFHNGEAFNAEAVQFSIDRVLDEDLASGNRARYTSIESVEIEDDYTVILHLSEADAGLPAALGQLHILPPEYAATVGDDVLASEPVGTGPFRFVEWRPDDRLVVEANPDYFDGSPKGRALVDQVIFRTIPEAVTRVGELTAGDVAVMAELPADHISTVENAGATPLEIRDARQQAIYFNAVASGPIAENPGELATAFEAVQDVRVRQALNYAIDRQSIIDNLLAGFGEPLGGLFAPGGVGYDPNLDPYPYDPDRAMELLEEAGFGEGFPVVIDATTTAPFDQLQVVIANLADIGIDASMYVSDVSIYNDNWIAKRVNPLRASRWGDPVNPDTILGLLIESSGFISHYANEEADALIQAQRATLDPEERESIIHELNHVLRDDPAAIYLYSAPSLMAVDESRVSGFQPHAMGWIIMTNVGAN